MRRLEPDATALSGERKRTLEMWLYIRCRAFDVQVASAAVAGLASSVRGQIIDPGSPAYDEARRTYNAMIDRYPALIVRAADDSDVISTVRFAKERNLDLSVRGGAHNVAGFGTVAELRHEVARKKCDL